MMDRELFKKKYLGELSLKNGTHVKYLYPITKEQVYVNAIESKQLYKTIQKYKNPDSKYYWVLFDDLSLAQFQIVFACTKLYGDNYWKRLWDERKK